MMLQQMMPSSKIPRFNPHGYQPPPQEKKPETKMPGKLFSKASGSTKKKADNLEPVDFSKFNIEDLLMAEVSNHLQTLPSFLYFS
jgi:hypothetical protein